MAAVLLLSGAAMAAGAEGAVHGSGTAKASSAVTSVAFSPDGTKVLIGSADFTASLWDATTSALVGIFTGHTGQVNSVAFSPDGTKVLTAAIGYEFSLNFYYTEIKLWNAATGELIRDFTMYTDHVVYSVAFSPDGTKALSGEGYYNSFLGTSQGNARLWDVATGTEIRSFTGHTGEVFSAAFSPDGTKVLTGSADNTARLWDTDSGTEIRSFAGHWSQVRSVAFSPDGSMALTGSADVTAKLWKTGTGEEIRTFTGHMDEIRSVAFSPDGTTVLTGSRDNTARLWNAASGAKVYTFTGHTDWVNSVAFSPDGTRAVTGSSDGTAKWWAAGGPVPDLRGLTEAEAGAALIAASLTSGEVTQECSNDVAAGQVISQSPAADSLASYGSAVALRVSTGPCNAPVYSAVFSPDGTTVLAGKQDGTAVLLDTATGATLNTLTGHTWQVNSVAFSPDGTQALTGGNGYDFQLSLPLGEIKLWNAATGKLIRDFTTHTDARVNSVAFSPDGTKVLTGEGVHNSETDTWSGATWLWNAATGREIHSFTGHTGEVYSAAFSPDGTKVLTGSADNTAKLWYTDSGTEIRTFSGHADQVRSVAFSPDGTTVLTGSWDYTARLWNAGTGNRIRSFSGHTNAVNSVAFSPDGIAVLTGSWDYTAKLWFAATGAEF
jgi:WD40 repeat protein